MDQKLSICCFRFSRVFTTTNSLSVQSTVNPSQQRERPIIQQHMPQRGVMDFLRRWLVDTPNEVESDDHGLICRPPQQIIQAPVQQELVGSTTSIFVERCQLLINGKPVNSMDLVKMELDQCPEAYLTFMK